MRNFLLLVLAITQFASTSDAGWLSFRFRKNCQEVINSLDDRVRVETKEPFDAKAILGKHGLELSRLRIFFEFSPGKLDSTITPFQHMKVAFDGKQIFKMMATRSPEDKALATASTFPMATQFRGKGVGAMGYLLLARQIYKNQGILLSNDYLNATSPEANKVWDSFVATGYVEKKGSDTYYFREDTLEDSSMWESIDHILDTQTTSFP